MGPRTPAHPVFTHPHPPLPPQVRNGSMVTMASKSQKGRWKGMDAGQDQSDDQVGGWGAAP